MFYVGIFVLQDILCFVILHFEKHKNVVKILCQWMFSLFLNDGFYFNLWKQ